MPCVGRVPRARHGQRRAAGGGRRAAGGVSEPVLLRSVNLTQLVMVPLTQSSRTPA